MSSAEPIYTSRVLKLPLVTPDGDTIGRVDDLVIGPPTGETAPILLGLVAQVGRRRIFVTGARVKHFETSGVVLNSSALDLHPFKGRTGELLLTSLLDRPLHGEKVLDLSMRPRTSLYGRFGIAEVMLGRRRALGFSARMRRVPWEEVKELFDVGEAAAELVKLRSLHPSETARHMQDLTDEARDELVEAMQDEDLADVLEELPEEDQAEILLAMEPERAAQVLEEMEPDDAADLLSELNFADQSRLLDSMDPEEAGPLRRLLIYEGHSAGGLMTPEPLVLLPEATVAEALARMRSEEMPAAVASCVFVTQPPMQPPTGVYLGGLSFQKLLREPPSTRLADLVDGLPEAVHPSMPEIEVAERLAAYNLLSLPVCDESGFLLGAVTVDDVLDRTLPVGWRTHQ